MPGGRPFLDPASALAAEHGIEAMTTKALSDRLDCAVGSIPPTTRTRGHSWPGAGRRHRVRGLFAAAHFFDEWVPATADLWAPAPVTPLAAATGARRPTVRVWGTTGSS